MIGLDTTALEDFPSDPDKFRLELKTKQEYTRDLLLTKLEGLGYEREDSLDASDLEKVDGYFKIFFQIGNE